MAKKAFMDYSTYEGSRGGPREWRSAFQERMGIPEAEVIIKGQKRTPLEILGLSSHGVYTAESIKRAYRLQTLKVHPDRAVANGMTVNEATEAFKQLQAAYVLLQR